MIVLVGIAFVAGMVTAISPCVLPVLPIVFAGGATGGPRRPYAIVAGLVVSFATFTLAATALLSALGLPADLLRNIAIGVVMAMGLSLLVPRLGDLLERPFRALGRRRPGDLGGGFLLGMSLGLLFTPCAGPVIAAVATVAATERFTTSVVLVTVAYALGAGVVLLPLAILARRGLGLGGLRERAPAVRRVLGGLIVGVAILMALGIDTKLQTRVPGYTQALQGLEESAAAATRINRLVGARAPTAHETTGLEDFGRAPEFAGISLWINSKPLTLQELRGKVVLVDFWTYSCINCLRTLPFLTRWDAAYRDQGLVIVGVHTPEFAFEREQANVGRAIADLGIRYPVALDPEYGTWNAWGNQYWPAEYFIDKRGHVRYAHFGEGEYEQKERIIRTLLAEDGLPTPVSASIRDQTPTGPQTAETYLGYARVDRIVGDPVRIDREAEYELPGFIPEDSFALGGRWTIEKERIVAGARALLSLRYHGEKAYLVLGGKAEGATVQVTLDGRREQTIRVDGDRLYTLVDAPRTPGSNGYHLLQLAFSPGVEAYAFTFG